MNEAMTHRGARPHLWVGLCVLHLDLLGALQHRGASVGNVEPLALPEVASLGWLPSRDAVHAAGHLGPAGEACVYENKMNWRRNMQVEMCRKVDGNRLTQMDGSHGVCQGKKEIWRDHHRRWKFSNVAELSTRPSHR